ncbi:MAG: hypothetical protein FJ137_05805 [Deltaproteobacteria bacterium]|nr:hypothetical protein [Deltaproteobacteria bacterium]
MSSLLALAASARPLVRAAALALFVVVGSGACVFDPAPSGDAAIACDDGDECPDGLVCARAVQRCVEAGRETEAPQATFAGAPATPLPAGGGVVLAVTLSEPLVAPPAVVALQDAAVSDAVVVFGAPNAVPYRVDDDDDGDPLTWTLRYVVTGDERPASGALHAVDAFLLSPPTAIVLVDVVGNRAVVPVPGFAIDLVAPVVTVALEEVLAQPVWESAPPDEYAVGGPAPVTVRGGATLRLTVRAHEPLTAPALALRTVAPDGAGTAHSVPAETTTSAQLTWTLAAPVVHGTRLELSLEAIADRAGNALGAPLLPSLIVDATPPAAPSFSTSAARLSSAVGDVTVTAHGEGVADLVVEEDGGGALDCAQATQVTDATDGAPRIDLACTLDVAVEQEASALFRASALDAVGNAAAYFLALPYDTRHPRLVDGATATMRTTMAPGDPLEVVAVYDEPVTGAVLLSADDGATQRVSIDRAGEVLSSRVLLAPALRAAESITVSVTDVADAFGNPGAAPAPRVVVIDRVAPAVRALRFAPAVVAPGDEARACVTLDAADDDATLVLAVDGERDNGAVFAAGERAFERCASVIAGDVDEHVISVTATDAVGNAGATVAVLRVDRRGPNLVGSSVSFIAGARSFVTDLDRLGPSSTAALQVVFDEPVAAVAADADDLDLGPVTPCPLEPERCLTVSARGPKTAPSPSERAEVRFDVVDAFGNRATATVGVAIDSVPPVVDDPDALLLVRQPEGRIDERALADGPVTSAPGVALVLSPTLRALGAEPVVAVVLDGPTVDSVEYCRVPLAGRTADSAPVVCGLPGRDRADVYVLLVDRAGNAAPATRVRRGRFFGSTAADAAAAGTPAATLTLLRTGGLARFSETRDDPIGLPPRAGDEVAHAIAQRRFGTRIGSGRLPLANSPPPPGGRTRGAFDPRTGQSVLAGFVDDDSGALRALSFDGEVLAGAGGALALHDLAFDVDGRVWLARADGLLVVAEDAAGAQAVEVFSGMSTTVVQALAIDAQRRVLVVGDVATAALTVGDPPVEDGGELIALGAATTVEPAVRSTRPGEPGAGDPGTFPPAASPWLLLSSQGGVLAHAASLPGGPPVLSHAAVAGDDVGFVVYGGRDRRGIACSTTYSLELFDGASAWVTTPRAESAAAPPALVGHTLTTTGHGIVLAGCGDELDDASCGLWLWDWSAHAWQALRADRPLRPQAVAGTVESALLVVTADAAFAVSLDPAARKATSRPLPTLSPLPASGIAATGGGGGGGGRLCAFAGSSGPQVACRIDGIWRPLVVDGAAPLAGSTPHAVTLADDTVLVASRSTADAFVVTVDAASRAASGAAVVRPTGVPFLAVGLAAIPDGAVQVGGFQGTSRVATVAVFDRVRGGWSTSRLPPLPEPVAAAGVGYDPLVDAIAVFPGASPCAAQRRLFLLALGAPALGWTSVTLPDSAPVPVCRNNAQLLWDDARGALVLAAGTGGIGGARDLHALELELDDAGVLQAGWRRLGDTAQTRLLTGGGVDEGLGGLVLHGSGEESGEDAPLFDAVRGLRAGHLVRIALPDDLQQDDVDFERAALRVVLGRGSARATLDALRRYGVVATPVEGDVTIAIDPRASPLLRLSTPAATSADPDPRVLVDALQLELDYVIPTP